MTYQTLLFEKKERVATISLNRPQAMNALDLVMMKELGQVFAELQQEKDIQIVILKGEGRAFSSGGDIKGMLGGDLDIEEAMILVSNYIRTLYTLPMITIAQIHGAAAGLGLSTALACDFVIAEETSKIAMNFIGIGLVPDGGGHFFMQERLGAVKAKQAIWQGEVMPGTKAQKIGLVDELVAEGLLEEEVGKLKETLLASPIAAMIATKKIINTSKVNELNEVLKQETKMQPLMRQTADHLEGIQAFVEKRQPKFTGK